MTIPKLAFFDLDGTLLDGDSISLFLACLKDEGIVDEQFCTTDQELIEEFYAGKLDILKYYRYSLTPVAGKKPEELSELFDRYLTNYVRPYVLANASTRINELKKQGTKIIIVSATTDLVVNEIALKIFKADHVIATRVMYDEEGRIIADVHPDISHQEGKASRIRELCSKLGYSLENSEAFGDSINDIPMLMLASKQYVVNPHGKMKEEALSRNWEVLNWTVK